MEKPVLEMCGITKRFPGVTANDNVNLTVYPGEIHALLGENGAGKSTLMNILTGIYAPNSGRIVYQGKEISITSPKSAIAWGIGMVHQHFKLIETLTVTENIYLAAGKKCGFWLNRHKMENDLRQCSAKFNVQVDAGARVDQLSVGEQQRVEILKLLYCGADLLILDEPTAILTPQETEQLFKNLKDMTQTGKSVIFITHKLFEVMEYSERITVLRGGKSVATMLTRETDQDTLVKHMVGRTIEKMPSARDTVPNRKPVLTMRSVSALNDKQLPALRDLSLTLYSGEIFGIAGVAGNGQKELTEVIAGLRPIQSGAICLNDTDITQASAATISQRGVAYIPEDRMQTGLVGSMNILENVILRRFNCQDYAKHGILRQSQIRKSAQRMVEDFEIKNAGFERPVSLMSGGNLQKLLLAREVCGEPALILAAYPVHGVDVGATEEIHRVLLQERNRGAAVLLISEDLEELYEMSDRVGAIFEGRMVGIVDIKDFTYDGIGRLMTGAYEPSQSAERNNP